MVEIGLLIARMCGILPGASLSQERQKTIYGIFPMKKAITGRTALYTIEDGIAVFKEYCDKHDADFVKERDIATYQAPQRQSAETFIMDFLKNGKKPTAELDEAAKAAGISSATLSRAKTSLRERGLIGMKSEGYGQNKAWYCYLIEQQHQRGI